MADQVDEKEESILGGLACHIRRNYYGSQLESFIVDLQCSHPHLANAKGGIFIRAPYIETIKDDSVKKLATIIKDGKEQVVAVQQNNLLALTFHPELTKDTTWHEYFIKEIIKTCIE